MPKGLKVIPLGGVQEIGINSTLVEYGNTQILVDAGFEFPTDDLYGVDYIIPNISYLKKAKKDLKIFITHGHLDHIGALPFILPDLNYPEIFCTPIVKELILKIFERNNHDFTKLKINLINSDSIIRLKDFNVKFFGVNHSIPEALSVVVETDQGNLVFTGDFKFDRTPELNNNTEYDKIIKYRKEGVLALFSDSTNSLKPGHSLSDRSIYLNLSKIIKEVKGRVIIATFSSLLSRIVQLIRIAQITNRKVLILGRSMQTMVEIAQKLGYIHVDNRIFIDTYAAKKIHDSNLLVIATGAQGETFSALNRIANGQNRDLKLKVSDTVILSSSTIPSNIMQVQTLIDNLFMKGANVLFGDFEIDLHTSGHGLQEDQKEMIRLTHPKYFIPIHGYQAFLYKHAQTAVKVGVNPRNVLIPLRGDVIQFQNQQMKRVDTVAASPIYVSGNQIGDVGATILSEREQLADSGILIISALIDKGKHALVNAPELIIRGFVFEKGNSELISEIKQKVIRIISKNYDADMNKIKQQIQSELHAILLQRTGKNPFIIPIINFN